MFLSVCEDRLSFLIRTVYKEKNAPHYLQVCVSEATKSHDLQTLNIYIHTHTTQLFHFLFPLRT